MIAQQQIIEETPFFAAKLPLPPGVNEAYKIISIKTKEGKKAHTLAATKALKIFKEEAAWRLIEQRSKQNWDIINDIIAKKRKRVHVSLKATMTFYVKSLWRSDLDGFVKAAQDAAFKSMGVNDNLVTKLDIEKTLTSGEEYCEIEVCIRDVEEYRAQCENEEKRRMRQRVAS